MHEAAVDQSLTAYAQIINRRKWWVLAVIVLAVAAAVAISATQAKQYTATAQVLAQSTGSSTTATVPLSAGQLATYAQLVTSAAVTKPVATKFGGDAPPVSVYVVGVTNLIAIAATNPNATRAAAIANEYANAFAAYELGIATNQAKALVSQYTVEAALLSKQLTTAIHNNDPSEELALATELGGIRGDLAAAEAAAANPTSAIVVSSSATIPSSPSSSKPILDVLLGLLIGVILGVSLAFFLDYQDDRLKTAGDVQHTVRDLPVLAAIPKMASWKKPKDPVVTSLTDPTAPEVEAYWSLRASLKFLARERHIRSVVVTSPAEGDGKTATVANLGVVLAESGERTVIVSCDLRRPRLGSFFKGSRGPGLTSVLLGEVTLDQAVSPVQGVPNLWLLDTGPLPPNPHRALADAAVQNVFHELSSKFDMVLVDSPPLLPVADALALGQVTDTTIVITSFGHTRKRQLRLALDMLETAHISVAGVILNEVPPKASSGYAYYYGYGPDSRRQAAAHKKSRTSRGPLTTAQSDTSGNGSAPSGGVELPEVAQGRQMSQERAGQAEAPG